MLQEGHLRNLEIALNVKRPVTLGEPAKRHNALYDKHVFSVLLSLDEIYIKTVEPGSLQHPRNSCRQLNFPL